MAPKSINSWDVQQLLRKRYSAPAWAYLEEVRNSTGYIGTPRTADGLAMSLWPSRGLSVHGFEVKVSRSDVVKELRTPEKAEAIMKYCDHWWLVLGDAKIIEPGELPPTWGLMVVRGKTQLRAVTEAPKLEPKPLDRNFIASLLRNFEQSYAPKRELKALQDSFNERVREEVKETASDELSADMKLLERQRDMYKDRWESNSKLIDDFRAKSGVSLAAYNLGNLLDAMQVVQCGNVNMIRRKLQLLATQSKDAMAYAENAIATLDTYESTK